MKEAKIKFNEDYVLESAYNYEAGVKAWEQLNSLKATPDAIYVADDELAMGVLNAALDAGVKVPEELEIVTSNNTKLTLMLARNYQLLCNPFMISAL